MTTKKVTSLGLLIGDFRMPIGSKLEELIEIGNLQSAIGNRQSTNANRQSLRRLFDAEALPFDCLSCI